MATVHERIARARDALVSAGIDLPEAVLDAQLLARHVLGWDRAQLLSRGREPVPPGFDTVYDETIARRSTREPVAQITGHHEFWSLDLEVTPDVLTPRPETELIVEETLALYAGRAPGLIVDVGTGSGCLAIALAIEYPGARIIATDVSTAALEVAGRNIRLHGLADRVELVQADLFPDVDSIDLIVSNPPYISERDAVSLPPEVRDHEPHVALFGGPDGLMAYRRLLPDARTRLKQGGRLIVEVGYDQHRTVIALAAEAGFRLVHTRRDLQGITRVLVLQPDVTETKP
jgi:release factor glutamine methyltransferase